MKFHLQRASDLTWQDIDIIEINSLEGLKELPIKYRGANYNSREDCNKIVIDFDKTFLDKDDDTDGTITIYDYYIE